MGVWTPGPGATEGDDVFTGDASNENVDGSGGNDQLSGGNGADILRGGEGDDSLASWTNGADNEFGVFYALFGEEGNDFLQGGLEDLYDGGDGEDFAAVRGRDSFLPAENLTLDLTVRDSGGDVLLPGGGHRCGRT